MENERTANQHWCQECKKKTPQKQEKQAAKSQNSCIDLGISTKLDADSSRLSLCIILQAFFSFYGKWPHFAFTSSLISCCRLPLRTGDEARLWDRGAQQSGHCFFLREPEAGLVFFLAHRPFSFSHYEEMLLRRAITITTAEITPNTSRCSVKAPCVQQLWRLPSFPPSIFVVQAQRSLGAHCGSSAPPGHTGRLLQSLCFTSLSFLLLHVIYQITVSSLLAGNTITSDFNCECTLYEFQHCFIAD